MRMAGLPGEGASHPFEEMAFYEDCTRDFSRPVRARSRQLRAAAASGRQASAQQRFASTPTTSAASSPGPKGPEAGVWVIAETTDLPTSFVRIVVTDDRGRYLMPDLPKATYNVWVRGYGLVDSPKAQATPGKIART